LSASSCSTSSSISGRGRQEPVPTRPASLSEVMSGMNKKGVEESGGGGDMTHHTYS
jgi:hypothetical protein